MQQTSFVAKGKVINFYYVRGHELRGGLMGFLLRTYSKTI